MYLETEEEGIQLRLLYTFMDVTTVLCIYLCWEHGTVIEGRTIGSELQLILRVMKVKEV